MAMVEVATADEYIETSVFGGSSAWAELTEAQKAAALQQAENQLETVATLDAANAKHINAVVEQALFIVNFPDAAKRAALQAQGVVDAGIVKERYRENGVAGVHICPYAQRVLGVGGAFLGAFKPEVEED